MERHNGMRKPKKQHDWSPMKRSRVLGLIDGGRHSIQEIGEIVGIPKSMVGDIKMRNIATTKFKCGRLKKLTVHAKRRIERHIKKSKATCRQDCDAIIKELQLNVCATMLMKALLELGYTHSVARRRPLLKELDMKRRLKFARAHKNWTVEDWNRVIFTDEMSIKVGQERTSCVFVWRKKGEEYHKDYVDARKRSTGGMMFWGAFRGGKMGLGFFFELAKGQTINSVVYRNQVLLGPLKTFVDESRSKNFEPIVMEDNATMHKGVNKAARKKMKWVEYEHPPNSPDLNPIEHVWAKMKIEITKMKPRSRKQAKECLQQVWDGISVEYCKKLVDSMPKRLQ
jgi:transposase